MSASDSYVPNLYADVLAIPRKRQQVISRELFHSFTVISEVVADFILSAICVFAVYSFHAHLGDRSGYPIQKIATISIIFGVFAALSLQRMRENRAACMLVPICETEQILRTCILCQLLLLLLSFLLGLVFPPIKFFLLFVTLTISLLAEKRAFISLLRALHVRGYGTHRVVVYGASETVNRIASVLTYSPRHGLYPVAAICDDTVRTIEALFRLRFRHPRTVPIHRGPLTVAALNSLECDLLIVAMTHLSPVQVSDIRQIAQQAGSPIAILQDSTATERLDIDGMIALANIRPIRAWHSTFLKRFLDILLTSILLLLLAPLFLLISVVICFDSPGPAIFVQKRVGRNGELFRIFKFRSMYVTAPKYEPSPTESSDPRITRVGRILRRAGLDELPQLINVLLGSMSLVGPRPEMPFLVERHNAEHRPRLQVSPGITGLWQLSTDRAYPIHQNIHYDLYYIRNRTLCMDLSILLHTVVFAMRGGV